MLPIKLADPRQRYSTAALKAGLHLVASNVRPQPHASGHPPRITGAEGNPLLRTYSDGERTRALTELVGRYLATGIAVDEVAQVDHARPSDVRGKGVAVRVELGGRPT